MLLKYSIKKVHHSKILAGILKCIKLKSISAQPCSLGQFVLIKIIRISQRRKLLNTNYSISPDLQLIMIQIL